VTVSRKHAEIERSERGYRIHDVGSLNGTYVNRVRVDAVDLRNGDEIQVGKYRFKFVFA
jgi:pSer/pThr/pTyr-binding forkhead associated (FHA) protein